MVPAPTTPISDLFMAIGSELECLLSRKYRGSFLQKGLNAFIEICASSSNLLQLGLVFELAFQVGAEAPVDRSFDQTDAPRTPRDLLRHFTSRFSKLAGRNNLGNQPEIESLLSIHRFAKQ